jgi:VIT1/CCC1 family predicted Fe2+/Mn2+ transporter
VGTLAVALATYLSANDSGSAAVAFYIIAGIVTVAMPVLPWFYLRELKTVVGAPAA